MGMQKVSGPDAQYRETSLVDLAAILVRRRNTFFLVFAFIFLAGLVLALLSESKFRYTTIYQVAQLAEDSYLEPMAVTVATVEGQFIPQFIHQYRQENDRKPPFNLEVNSPKESGLVVITSDSTKDNGHLVSSAHTKILERVAARESRLLAAKEARLNGRLESVEKLIEQLNGVDDPGSALATAYEDRRKIQDELSSALPGTRMVVAGESLDKVSTSRALIGIVTVMLALVLGVFAAFVTEFISTVRNSMESE